MRVCLILLLLLLAGCVSGPGVVETREVREYQGERLGSVSDFRENSIKGPQYVNVSTYRLVVDGLVTNPKSYSYEEVISRPSYDRVITIYCVEGWDVKILWTGIILSDLIDEAGVDPRANTVKFYAVDGYTTTLPLSYIRDNKILLAYKMNNVTLPPERGFPFQLVAESKWGYKWIKWVTRIELTDNPEEKGFWEERGYSQEGNLSGPKFEQ